MKFKFKTGDIIIIAVILVATGLLFYKVYFNAKPGPIALIYNVDSLTNIAEIDLRKTKEGSYPYHDAKGNIDLTVEIKDGKIAMTEIECPDKVCVNTGFIGNSMMPIICLPNKIIIEIVEEEEDTPPPVVDQSTK